MRRVRFSGFPLALFLLTLLLPGAACRTEPGVTEERVIETLAALEEATLQQDPDAIARLLSPDFTARLVVPGENRPQIRVMNRGDYVRSLRLAFRNASPLDLDRTNTRVEIAADGRSARATYNLQRTESVNKRLEKRSTQNSVVLEFKAGELLIKSLHIVDL